MIDLTRFATALLMIGGFSNLALAEQRCESYFFEASPGDQFRSATVIGKESSRIYFHDRGEMCPAEGCRRDTYLVPGDRLLTNQTNDDWVCVYFKDVGKAPVIGWLPKKQLNIVTPNPHPDLDAWLGNWANDRSRLHIGLGPKSGTVAVYGTAHWGDGPAPHTGSVEGTAMPLGNQIRIEDGACKINLSLVGEWLIAADNSRCGGLNVTFTSVYGKDQHR
ncbi:hypothetical protein WV31_18015 [Magnetospirillum sp. ME-1]|uniref:hypothetical protein n=1 Tax=Magnetospirillum sp. ME-1 TaxID=1639348 RepID=UPI000A17B551|nr:hypothetical protein [Magnetospirillum sp. ME-1]ARJ67425.1 hypothetical protein WV31_18015 [Magnetospirillum sp. ME-1]